MALKRLPSNPVLTTIGLFAAVAAVCALLRWWTQLGDETDQAFADSNGFRGWVIVAALVAVAFAHTLISGVFEIAELEDSPRWRVVVGYVVGFAAFAALVIGVLRLGGSGGPDVPIQYWAWIRNTLLGLGCLAATPWVVLVWILHGMCAEERSALRGLVSPPDSGSGESDPYDAHLRRLLGLNALIKRAVGKLLIVVTGAVLTSGALRAALVPHYTSEEDFPESAIVLYGAFFAVMLAFAVIPLLMAWRAAARELLDSAYPFTTRTSAEGDAARARLAARLDLDGSLFSSPIALSSILAPLVTSALAVFVPQLGS